MDAFTIQIAGLTAQVQPMFVSTKEYCRPYLSEEKPECYIEVTEQDLVYEQEMSEKVAAEEGIRIRKYKSPYLERATIQRKVALELLKRDTVMVHGSTVGLDGEAYLFTAPCGTGKSTHTRLWREVYGQRAVMVNDDKPFLRITPAAVYACGSPWSGKHGLDSNVCLPLKGICFLRRGAENRIRRIGPEDCFDELLHQSFSAEDSAGQAKILELVQSLSRIVPLWEMECTKDPEAALVSHGAMSGCTSTE